MIAAETSPSTGRRYGIVQVCRIWEVPRSSFYAERRRTDTTTPVPAQRRGPKPASPTMPYWRRSAPISPVRPGTARDIARCGRGCG